MVLDNESLLDPNHIVPTLISIEEMQSTTNKEGVNYLEEGTIKSPLDQSEMKGTVIITYDESSKSYLYEYQEKTKEELSSLVVMPAAKAIISKQPAIYTNERESGLFEDVELNQYIFKGENPKNFIKIGNSLWRIISIDKDTYTMKVAKTTHNVKSVWSTSSAETNPAFSNTNLKIYTYLNSDFYNTLTDSIKSNMVENSEWNIGSVSGSIKDVKGLIQEEKASTFHANVGLVTVGDYAKATYDLSCRKDFTGGTCSTTNYLVLDKEYFLLNNVKGSTAVWSLSAEIDGALKQNTLDTQLNVIPVIQLKATAEIMAGGNGTIDNPYTLKTT